MEGDDPRFPLYNRVAELCVLPAVCCFRGSNGEIIETELASFGYDCWQLDDGASSFSEYQMNEVGALRRGEDGCFIVTAVPPSLQADNGRNEESTETKTFDSPAKALDWFLSVATPGAWIPPEQRPWWWESKLAKIDGELVASFAPR